MKRIIVLIPYFGRWPEWFPLYLETCRWNPNIRWLFFTDCGKPAGSPPNVEYQEMTIDGFEQLASEKLNLKIEISKPHKLCDFKLAYGHIFEDYIGDYDYFAFSDIDVVYGDLEKYLTDEMLEHDIVTFSKTVISGHLCLLKNNDHVKWMYRKIPEFDTKIVSKRVEVLDELNLTPQVVMKVNCPQEILDEYAIYKIAEAQTTPFSTRGSWVEGETWPKEWIWKQGQISTKPASRAVFPYFHFMHWKNGSGTLRKYAKMTWLELDKLVYVSDEEIKEGFRITGRGFHPLERNRPVQFKQSRVKRMIERMRRARRFWISRRRLK